MVFTVVSVGSMVMLLTIAAKTRGRDDLFAPVKPYIYRERTAIVDLSGLGLAPTSPQIYRVYGMHLRGIIMRDADKLMQSRLEAAGYGKESDDTQMTTYTPRGLSPGDLNEIEITDGSMDRMSGIVITEIQPARRSDIVLARIENLGRDPILKPQQVVDMKQFFRE